MLKATVTKLRDSFTRGRKITGYRATLGNIEVDAPSESEARLACEAKALRVLSEDGDPLCIHLRANTSIIVYRTPSGEWAYFFARGADGFIARGSGWNLLGPADRKEAAERALKHAEMILSDAAVQRDRSEIARRLCDLGASAQTPENLRGPLLRAEIEIRSGRSDFGVCCEDALSLSELLRVIPGLRAMPGPRVVFVHVNGAESEAAQ